MKKQTLEPGGVPPELRELVEKLLAESWAKTNGLGEITVEQLGRALEEARESFDGSDDSSASFLREKASFEHCVEIYCSILIWAESSGGQLPSEVLEDLAPPSNSLPQTQEAPIPPEFLKEQEVNELWNQMTANSPKGESPHAEAAAEEGADENGEWGKAPPPPPPRKGTHLPEPPRESAKEVLPELPEWTAPVPDASAAEKIESADDLPEWNPSAGTPVAMPQLSVKDAPEPVDSWEETPIAEAAEALREHSTEPPHALTNARAREYWQLYEHFRAQEVTWPLGQGQLTKLIAQSACFSLEAELIDRLEPAIKTFWSQREAPIRHLLDQGNRKFELTPALKSAVNKAAEDHTEWLLEGKFPHAAVLTSLRYMLATLQPEKFQPSLLEAGILLFFFGQQTKLGTFDLQNLLHVGGVSSEQLMEMMFRLSRLHRLRAKTLGATTDFEKAQLTLLVADAKALLTMLESIQVGEKFADRKAA